MKKIILLSLLFVAAPSFADKLHNFNEIKAALIKGKAIHIVVDFAQCLSAAPFATGSINIGVFSPTALQVSTNHIATSLLHFTLNNPSFPERPVYEFVKYTITEKEVLDLSYQVLDATNYMSLGPKMIFNCPLNSGAKIYG